MKSIIKLILLIPTIPIIILMRLLRPFILIRLVRLRSGRIGHYSQDTEYYICQRELGKHPKSFDICYNTATKHICNMQLAKMWDRVLFVSVIGRILSFWNDIIPGGNVHTFDLKMSKKLNGKIHWLLENTRPHLFFTPKEEELGAEFLKRIGVDQPFVCLHTRDSKYLNQIFKSETSTRYHDYRNCTISNYRQGAERLAEKGYFVLRIGKMVKERLVSNHPRIIDCSKFKPDFLNIYLSAKCKFFIGCGSGPDSIAVIFRKPTLFVNAIPIKSSNYWEKNHMFIPKKLWIKKERRFMSLQEMLTLEVGSFNTTDQYENAGIEVVENSAKEIGDAMMEYSDMLDDKEAVKILDGEAYTKDKEERQERFWKLYNAPDTVRARVDTSFLKSFWKETT